MTNQQHSTRKGSVALLLGLALGSALTLLPSPAAAGVKCHTLPAVYSTGTLTGTGSTCADAQAMLSGNLFATATDNCIQLHGDNSDVSTFNEMFNSCVPNGSGKLETGSAQYQCEICTCIGLNC